MSALKEPKDNCWKTYLPSFIRDMLVDDSAAKLFVLCRNLEEQKYLQAAMSKKENDGKNPDQIAPSKKIYALTMQRFLTMLGLSWQRTWPDMGEVGKALKPGPSIYYVFVFMHDFF